MWFPGLGDCGAPPVGSKSSSSKPMLPITAPAQAATGRGGTPTASMPIHTPEACDWPKAVQEFFAAEKKAVAEMDAHTPVTRRVRSADVTQLSLATSPLAWEFISKRVEAAESVAAAAVQKQVAGEKAAEK